jgi:hypothetical protein
LAIGLSVLFSWPLVCLSFSLGHWFVYQEKRTDKPMAKRKGQTNQWPRENDRQTNGQEKGTDKAMVKKKGIFSYSLDF